MMKDLMKEVTHTRWAKVEIRIIEDNRFDVVFHTRRIPFSDRMNEFHAGDFHIEKWNLDSREIYRLIRHYFSTLANNGMEKLIEKTMNAIVDLKQTYFLTVGNRMDHIHQQANEENTAFDLNRMETAEKMYLVDLQEIDGTPLETDLEAGKDTLRNMWAEDESISIEAYESIDDMDLNQLISALEGRDYSIMTEKEIIKMRKEEAKPMKFLTKTEEKLEELNQRIDNGLEVTPEVQQQLEDLTGAVEYEFQALRFAERVGIIDYTVNGHMMNYTDTYTGYKWERNLITLEDRMKGGNQ